jgi:hypothetical protein
MRGSRKVKNNPICPIFTDGHYSLIAKALIRAYQRSGFTDDARAERVGIEHVRQELLVLFERDNPAFDASRFADATQPLLSALAHDTFVEFRDAVERR